jgi:hypothetical protein
MNTRWTKKFIKEAREVKITAHEKRAMLARILGPAGIPSPYSFFLTVMEYRRKIVAIAVIAAFIFTSGGTSFVAASALPGDALYSIKVNFNEEIQSIAAVSANAKVKVEVKRTEKRLQEAETLSKSGKLNAETQAIIENNIEKHSETIKENIATLTSENAVETVKEVVADLATSIEAHQAVAEKVFTMSISSDVASTSISASTSTLSDSESESRIDSIVSKITEVKDELEDIGEDVASTSIPALPDSAVSTSTATSTEVLPQVDTTATSTASTTVSTSPALKPSDIL